MSCLIKHLFISQILIYALLSTNCQDSEHKDSFSAMPDREEITIQNELKATIAIIELKDSLLDGRCRWFDGRGNLISDGEFRLGLPYSGTIVNWSKFIPEFDPKNPFQPSIYCQDWVSRFELSFRSAIPNYELVMESYVDGKRISE